MANVMTICYREYALLDEFIAMLIYDVGNQFVLYKLLVPCIQESELCCSWGKCRNKKYRTETKWFCTYKLLRFFLFVCTDFNTKFHPLDYIFWYHYGDLAICKISSAISLILFNVWKWSSSVLWNIKTHLLIRISGHEKYIFFHHIIFLSVT